MKQDYSKIHYKKCRYPSCNLTSRDGVPGLTFHAFPVRQSDRCIKWLVNCGLDDWVEMSEKELRLRYICSRHFPEDNFYATGRLKREAVPIILGLDNSNQRVNKKDIKIRRVVSTEVDLLKKQIEKLETKLEKERQKKLEIRAKLCATRVALSRLKSKLTEGTFQDIYLNKALANRLEGFVLTFIRMQLFHKQSTCYTTDEQRLCMMMHCISPALYSKMRDDFKFVLPNEITMVRWFNKLNISPKKANFPGSFNFEKVVQILKNDKDDERELEKNLKTADFNDQIEYLEDDEMEVLEGLRESEEDESDEYLREVERLTTEHLKELENDEVIDDNSKKTIGELTKILTEDISQQESLSLLPEDSGGIDNSEYVAVTYYETRGDGVLTPVNYLSETVEVGRFNEILNLDGDVDSQSYSVIEQVEINEELISAQSIGNSENFIIE